MSARIDPRPPSREAEFALAGERLRLGADRSLFWPAGRTLIVADTHFGKAGVFRQRGVNVPSGTTADDLDRLARALDRTGARRLVVLGDFLHAPPRGDEPWLARFAAWRARHASVEIIVTRGNHDRVRCAPDAWHVDWVTGACRVGPFLARHDPFVDDSAPVLAGHLHPVVQLSAGRERLRAPVFWRHARGLVLPAFCSFAGGARITPAAGDRVFAVGDEAVVEAGLDGA